MRLTHTEPDQWIDQSRLAALQQRVELPTRGTVVRVNIPGDASGFAHRTDVVYLPPAWFATDPPPQLPGVIMIGGEINHPNDWLQSAGALEILDNFAALHQGNAPVVVFPDIAGKFDNDTECVDGTRGNAAAHLTKDVVPYMISRFGVSPRAENWGMVGWSSGGTCGLTTSVRNPDMLPPPPTHCAPCSAATTSNARWSATPVRTTSSRPGRHSKPRCRGWPVNSAHPRCGRGSCPGRTRADTRLRLIRNG